MTSHPYYGEAPEDLGPLELAWDEFLHYLYLPVRIPAHDDPAVGFKAPEARQAQVALPDRLEFLWPAITAACEDAGQFPHLTDAYVYVTARRGFATPGNPLNRPGWHCDDFGGTDLNYIWSDVYPTRLLLSDYALALPTDDARSMLAMRALADEADPSWGTDANGRKRIEDAPAGHLLRLSPYVIHDTPIIPAPGGMRSFFKISVSSHRYNLRGNSHNYLLDYDWPMYDRAALRNQPQGGNSDYVTEGASA